MCIPTDKTPEGYYLAKCATKKNIFFCDVYFEIRCGLHNANYVGRTFSNLWQQTNVFKPKWQCLAN